MRENTELRMHATLEVIFFMLKSFKNIDDQDEKLIIKRYGNLRRRMKDLISDVYECLKEEGYKSGVSRKLTEEMEFWKKGGRVKNAKPTKVWEHTIPWNYYFHKMIKLHFSDSDELLVFLQKTFCNCEITNAEDKYLNAEGLKKKMPENWDAWSARYEQVGIILLELPNNPSNPVLENIKEILDGEYDFR